ncbi:MAG: 30S ribosomal protein S20 [Proteobacteria bacterium]|nr:30S ribosomal protein S20 [Pseudomonadota bacterium]
MAHHKSALKRIRQTAIRTERNRAGRSKVKHAIRAFREACAEKKEGLEASLNETIATLSKAASKGIIPAKRANRKIGRLTRLLNATQA